MLQPQTPALAIALDSCAKPMAKIITALAVYADDVQRKQKQKRSVDHYRLNDTMR